MVYVQIYSSGCGLNSHRDIRYPQPQPLGTSTLPLQAIYTNTHRTRTRSPCPSSQIRRATVVSLHAITFPSHPSLKHVINPRQVEVGTQQIPYHLSIFTATYVCVCDHIYVYMQAVVKQEKVQSTQKERPRGGGGGSSFLSHSSTCSWPLGRQHFCVDLSGSLKIDSLRRICIWVDAWFDVLDLVVVGFLVLGGVWMEE